MNDWLLHASCMSHVHVQGTGGSTLSLVSHSQVLTWVAAVNTHVLQNLSWCAIHKKL